MNFGLEVLDKITGKDKLKPSNIEFIYYIFWEKGIDYHAFNKLPIPYIMTILKSNNWIKAEEEKAHKKAMKK